MGAKERGMRLTTVSCGSDTRLQIDLDPRPHTVGEVRELRGRLDTWLAGVDRREPDWCEWTCLIVGPLPAEPVEDA